MINDKSHIEEKIVLLIDGELDKDQIIEVKKHLKDCPECKEVYRQLLSIKNETSTFYKTIGKRKIEAIQRTVIGYKYALVLLLFLLVASVGIIFLNTKQSEKINTINLIHEDQIDKQIINMEREIDLLKKQMSVEVL